MPSGKCCVRSTDTLGPLDATPDANDLLLELPIPMMASGPAWSWKAGSKRRSPARQWPPLARLPDDYRELLVQRHIEERTFEEIAQTMQRSSAALRTMWVRALRKLKDAVSAEIELSLRLATDD